MATRLNGAKFWLGLILGLIVFATAVYSMIDSTQQIKNHDSCAVAHPDLRKNVDTLTGKVIMLERLSLERNKTLDSIKVEIQYLQKDMRKGIDEIKELIKKNNGG